MISRRVFLKSGGLGLVSLGAGPSFLARTVGAGAAPRRKVLVAIFQRGAVDGLDVVVPFGERAYYAMRPSIAIPRPGSGSDAAIDLDGFFALHPRLAPLKRVYDAGHLAIVHAFGSPDATRSHFDAQDYMETATPGVKSTTDGWLNRYLRAQGRPDATALRGVAISSQLPRSLQGRAPALAIGQLGPFGIRAGQSSGDLQRLFQAKYAATADVVLNGTAHETLDAIKVLEDAAVHQIQPGPGAEYPRTRFGNALRQIAQLVKAEVGLEIAFAELGGWDTHANQGSSNGQLAGRIDDLARSVAAFIADLGDRLNDVVVMTMSEFGRTVAENSTRGTDHGRGSVMLVAGGPVRGGRIYGEWPGLERELLWEGRDLAVTTDFRDVFAEVAVRHLGVADAGPIFPGYAIRQSNFRGLIPDP